LNVHPDGQHIVYPLGCKVVVQNWKTKRQIFLSGHTNAISAIAVSPNGRYIASGQINYMGFKVSIDSLTLILIPKAAILRAEYHGVSAAEYYGVSAAEYHGVSAAEYHGVSASCHGKMSGKKTDKVWVDLKCLVAVSTGHQ
jgi:WD40 repeat protein